MMDKMQNVLPIVMAIEAFVACIPYFYLGKYGSGIYWLSASAITVGVLLIPRVG